jgi:hypothetical protein
MPGGGLMLRKDFDRMFPADEPATLTDPGLHWATWATYVIVWITCAAVLIALIKSYMFITDFQDAVNDLSNSFTNLIGE